MMSYSKDTEENIRTIYEMLDERKARMYAAAEASKLGHGGIKYISELLEISSNTIKRGEQDLNDQKKILDLIAELEELVEEERKKLQKDQN